MASIRKIYLIIGVHNHQPVGNFPFVFEEVYQKAYFPFLTIPERYPRIKITLHYSKVLIKWIEENHFPFLGKVKKLIEAGQVELMSGGFYEPALSIIPDRDKLGQIKMLTEYIEKNH
jgi:alpha-amylase